MWAPSEDQPTTPSHCYVSSLKCVYHEMHVPNFILCQQGLLFRFLSFFFLYSAMRRLTADRTAAKGVTATSRGCKLKRRFKNKALMTAIVVAVYNFLERGLQD